MTKQDTYQVLAVLQVFYRDSFQELSNEAAQLKVELWQELFADEPVEEVVAAVKAYAATDRKGFPPVPGQIKEQIAVLRNQNGMSEQDAWEMVNNALRNSSYGSAEEFAKLPVDVQRAVGSANMLRTWATMPYDELQTVIASNFKRDYRSIVAQKKDFAKIPNAVKQLAAASTTKQIEGDNVGVGAD